MADKRGRRAANRSALVRRRPTITDVTRLASVSPTTASSALRGTGRMTHDTRERVVVAAGRLAYEADRRASALRETACPGEEVPSQNQA